MEFELTQNTKHKSMRILMFFLGIMIYLMSFSSADAQTNIFGGFYFGAGISGSQNFALETSPEFDAYYPTYSFIEEKNIFQVDKEYLVELGHTFYIIDGWKTKKFRLGIDLNAMLHFLKTNTKKYEYEEIEILQEAESEYYSLSAGVVISINLFNNIIFDFFGRIRNIDYFNFPEFRFTEASNADPNIFELYGSTDGSNIGHSYGIRVRNEKLFLTAEWTKAKGDLGIFEYDSYGGLEYGTPIGSFKQNFLNFTGGIFF